MSAKWQGACVPPDIRRPWDVFQEDVTETWIGSLTGEDRSSEPHLAIHKELRAVQKLGALQAFQALPAWRQRAYAEVSLQELSAFAAWNATCGLADAMERVAAWTALDVCVKAEHVLHNWRAPLAKDPTWHVFIADDVKEEVEEHQEMEGGGGGGSGGWRRVLPNSWRRPSTFKAAEGR